MAVLTLFNAPLPAAFTASQPFLMSGERVTFDFEIVVTGAPARVEWFLEFTFDDPNSATARWFREVAEEDIGGGVTNMPKVIRNFQENGGAGLAAGTHRLDAQLVRSHQFGRFQIRITAGVASATVFSVFGSQPLSGAA